MHIIQKELGINTLKDRRILHFCLFAFVTHLQLQCGLSPNVLTIQTPFWILYSKISGNPFALLKRLRILAWDNSDGD